MSRDVRGPESQEDPRSLPLSRWGTVIGALGCGIGLVGFLVGMVDQPKSKQPAVKTSVSQETGEATRFASAPNYAAIDSQVHGVNSDWQSDFAKLKQNRPQLTDLVVRTAEMKADALKDRLRTRAFDGAPPAIPHRIEQQTAQSCLVCHGEGTMVAWKIATKVSHPAWTNCTQCHVEQAGSLPTNGRRTKPQSEATVETRWPPDNTFEGVQRAGPGIRLMPGLPPTIPHSLHMREDCMSCHGLIARPGIRTTHPWLQNCRQCHVAGADVPSVATLERPSFP